MYILTQSYRCFRVGVAPAEEGREPGPLPPPSLGKFLISSGSLNAYEKYITPTTVSHPDDLLDLALRKDRFFKNIEIFHIIFNKNPN